MPHRLRARTDLRRRLFEILESGSVGDRTSLLVDRAIITLIVFNLVAATVESVPTLAERYAVELDALEYFSLVVFSVEYVARLWCAVEYAPYRRLTPVMARLKYAVSGIGLVDLLAVLPFWLAMVLSADFRFVLVLRMIRFLKIARYSPAMRSLLDVLYGERRALFGCLIILIGAALMAAALMHLAEGHVQPEKLGTIPDAMWWAIVTLGTVGYGDVFPITAAGKVIASATILTGLIMIALPVGIIATAFSEMIHRRDFLVTWGMMARVPLFSELDAVEIADVMRLLRTQHVSAGEIIVRRGEPAHSMYFIAQGEVEIELPEERVVLGDGHFFGEVAVLRGARRSATVVAMRRTSLLVLDARDLHALMDREPRIAKRLHEVARNRLKREIVGPQGDIVTEEIEDSKTPHA
jgi:voltage-gated potassium channel